jgi:3-oxoadipate CoA-transferase alpha subunit
MHCAYWPRVWEGRLPVALVSDKTKSDLTTVVAAIDDGMTIMVGGFGGAGAPLELIHALVDRWRATGSPANLTIVNNNAGNGSIGIAAMIDAGMVRKMICSFPRSADPRAFTTKYLAGEISLELVPQGTLAERIRAGGAGIPAFYTPAGYGTDVARGKPVAEFEGKHYVQERWLKADVALIKAETADTLGNLTYRKAARNFSPLMAMAARLTIVQATRIVQPGGIDPEQVITPGIFVDHIVEVPDALQEEAVLREGGTLS